MNSDCTYMNNDLGYTSPEPEVQSDIQAADEDEDEENVDIEDQDEVDADPFAGEPEDDVEASEGQPKGDGLDGELDGKQDDRERMPNIYSPNYAMHGTIHNINMHGSAQPEDHSSFQNINMHGSVQPEDRSNLTMHDANSYLTDTTNFHDTGVYPADINMFFGNLNYWTPAPGPNGQYNPLENFQTFGQVPSYPQPLSYPQPQVPSYPQPLSYPHPLSYPPCSDSPSQPSNPHPSDVLPPLPPAPSGNSPANLHPSDALPPLPPVPSGNSLANPSPLDTSPPLPHTQDAGLSAKASDTKASGAKASGVKMSGAKAPSGAKVSKKGKPDVPVHQAEASTEASTHQAETTTRKSARAPKPSTRNEMANAIGAQALSELREKENTVSVVSKKAHKRAPDASAEPIAKYCIYLSEMI